MFLTIIPPLNYVPLNLFLQLSLYIFLVLLVPISATGFRFMWFQSRGRICLCRVMSPVDPQRMYHSEETLNPPVSAEAAHVAASIDPFRTALVWFVRGPKTSGTSETPRGWPEASGPREVCFRYIGMHR